MLMYGTKAGTPYERRKGSGESGEHAESETGAATAPGAAVGEPDAPPADVPGAEASSTPAVESPEGNGSGVRGAGGEGNAGT